MEKNMFVYTDNFGDDNNVRLVLDMYRDNDNLFIGLEEHDGEFDYWDSYCDVTVNIAKLPFLESAININLGGQEKINFLIQNGFGELAGYSLPSGFCSYPVFRFNAEKIKEVDPDFFETYAKAHGQSREVHASLKDQISDARAKNTSRDLGSKPQKAHDNTIEDR